MSLKETNSNIVINRKCHELNKIRLVKMEIRYIREQAEGQCGCTFMNSREKSEVKPRDQIMHFQ